MMYLNLQFAAVSARTYFRHQNRFLLPLIVYYWESYRAALVDKVKQVKDAVWSGDGRFDSMGHCAKFGAYTMFCSTLMKVVHFELLQVALVLNMTTSLVN